MLRHSIISTWLLLSCSICWSQSDTQRSANDAGVRAFFGLQSIIVSYKPTSKDEGYYVVPLEFKNGKFLGELPGISGEFWKTCEKDSAGKETVGFVTFNAELVFGKRDGRFGYSLTAPAGSLNFTADPFFAQVGGYSVFLANGTVPEKTYEGYTVLGYATSAMKDFAGINADPAKVIEAAPYCVVFGLRSFPTAKEASQYFNSRLKSSRR